MDRVSVENDSDIRRLVANTMDSHLAPAGCRSAQQTDRFWQCSVDAGEQCCRTHLFWRDQGRRHFGYCLNAIRPKVPQAAYNHKTEIVDL